MRFYRKRTRASKSCLNFLLSHKQTTKSHFVNVFHRLFLLPSHFFSSLSKQKTNIEVFVFKIFSLEWCAIKFSRQRRKSNEIRWKIMHHWRHACELLPTTTFKASQRENLNNWPKCLCKKFKVEIVRFNDETIKETCEDNFLWRIKFNFLSDIFDS